MHVHRFVVPAAAVALVVPVLAGCGTDDGPGGGGPSPEDAAAEARQRVQSYLDAVKAKDVAAGRAQLCPVLHESFDQVATGPNGDFAEHFTVSAAVITDVRVRDSDHEIGAAVTVSGRPDPIGLRFTVTRTEGGWCIADEVPVDAGQPAGLDAGGGPSPSVAP